MIKNITAINEKFPKGIDLSDNNINFFSKQLVDFNDTENKKELNPLNNFKEIQKIYK